MSLQETVSAERVHIAWFGLRNAGKSSLVNAVTGQDVSIVSEVRGTTTDPVRKAMELLPLGPVVIIDTPGLDDEGELGRLRVERTNRILAQTDIAVLAVDTSVGLTELDREILAEIASRNIPFAVAYTKADLSGAEERGRRAAEAEAFAAAGAAQQTDNAESEIRRTPYIFTSAVTGEGIHELKELLGSFAPRVAKEKRILTDLVAPGSTVILVTPIDSSAPKGRLILPQQLTLRELLDAHCTAIVCQPEELADTLASLRTPPALVVTDSQAFAKVNAVVPADVKLTSFSILFARYKGNLKTLVDGAMAIDRLDEGDRVLISEGCTHHRQCEDIGTVKLPAWIERHVGFRLQFEFTSGGDFPSDLSGYRMVIHCGGCMLPEREMQRRLDVASAAGVPIVNYGIAIAHMNGILARSLSVFSENADGAEA
jgi:hydrogenase maturation GTPase HydF